MHQKMAGGWGYPLNILNNIKDISVKYRLLTMLLILAAMLIFPAVIQAEDPAADPLVVIVTYDNDDLITAATAHAEIIADKYTDIFNHTVVLVILLFTTILAYWHRDKFLFGISGIFLIIYGLTQINSETWYLSLFMVVLGIYNFFKAAWDYERRK
jgi:hypothetical protein